MSLGVLERSMIQHARHPEKQGPASKPWFPYGQTRASPMYPSNPMFPGAYPYSGYPSYPSYPIPPQPPHSTAFNAYSPRTPFPSRKEGTAKAGPEYPSKDYHDLRRGTAGTAGDPSKSPDADKNPTLRNRTARSVNKEQSIRVPVSPDQTASRLRNPFLNPHPNSASRTQRIVLSNDEGESEDQDVGWSSEGLSDVSVDQPNVRRQSKIFNSGTKLDKSNGSRPSDSHADPGISSKQDMILYQVQSKYEAHEEYDASDAARMRTQDHGLRTRSEISASLRNARDNLEVLQDRYKRFQADNSDPQRVEDLRSCAIPDAQARIKELGEELEELGR